MSRSNRNNRRKIRLSGNGNEQVCCSSSSSSSNSDDMDVIRNAVLKSLMKHGAKSSALSKTARNDAFVKKPIDLDNNLTMDAFKRCVIRSDDEKVRTDVKIVRVKTLDSKESKLLLIVDLLDKNPFRIEVNSDVKRENDEKCIEALKRGECPKEIRNLCTKVRSRRIYKLPDELMKKFDEKGLRIFEWHSFNKPDEVIKLLLDDGTKSTDADTVKGERKMIIGFKKRTECDEEEKNTETKVPSRGIRKSRVEARSRSRILQKLLKEYHVPGVWDVSQNRINRLVRSHLDLRAKEANERMAKKDDFCGTTRESRWKIGRQRSDFHLQQDHTVAVNVLLSDDNIASVTSNNADVNAIDDNNDALDNSNNDDNDSKAKKKNRCALCRKKVGLTGFECRCGGLYCGIHRYSDKHNCTFDYRQLGAQEIRRNNPVVIGEKIQKI